MYLKDWRIEASKVFVYDTAPHGPCVRSICVLCGLIQSYGIWWLNQTDLRTISEDNPIETELQWPKSYCSIQPHSFSLSYFYLTLSRFPKNQKNRPWFVDSNCHLLTPKQDCRRFLNIETVCVVYVIPFSKQLQVKCLHNLFVAVVF